MKSTSCRVPGTVGGPGAFSFCFGIQWILAILEPSGKGLPLAGMPALNASMIVGFPRMAATSLPLWLIGTTCQLSYVSNPANTRPHGTLTAQRAGAGGAL